MFGIEGFFFECGGENIMFAVAGFVAIAGFISIRTAFVAKIDAARVGEQSGVDGF